VPRIALIPAAAGGLVAGHFLTYVLVAPVTAQRAALLRATGHAYFSKAIAAGAALGAIAMGLSAARGWAQRHAGTNELGWRGLALRMGALQLAGFVILEVAERAVVQTSVGGIGAVLPAGFAVETAIACVVAALLCLTVRAAETIARAIAVRWERRISRSPRVAIPRAGDARDPLLDLLSFSVYVRGPPAPSIA
jgi:hypothetical protein